MMPVLKRTFAFTKRKVRFAPKCGRCAEESLIPKPVIPTCRCLPRVILG